MAYYSDDLIEEVISSNDIVDVVSEYLPLKKRGRNYIGLCPFHREKTPSFIVSSDKQICKCFGCSKGGGVINFVKEVENLEFKEALEFLANRANIDLTKYIVKSSYTSANEEIKIKKLKDTIYEINKEVAKYYHNNLIETLKDSNSLVKKYIDKRSLDMSTIIKFGLGYATGKVPLSKYLLDKGYSKDEILASGIIIENDNGKLYDRFFSRLIFPILDIRDRVIAFGGRVLDDSMPKYLNSAENIIYHKGKHLYGMNYARKINHIDKLIIVEGYMDLVSLQKAGFTNVVASLGTALTVDQARLIKKYTDNVVIGYDQDAAGQEAVLRSMDILEERDLNIKVLKLDKDDIKDPDEYVNKMGVERLKNCIDNSITLVEFKIEKYEKDLDLNNLDSKIKFLNNVANILSKIENNITRDLYVDKISEKYMIAKEPILKEINKKISVKFEESDITTDSITNKYLLNIDSRKKKEQYIIALLLLKDKNIILATFKNIDVNYFKIEVLKKLFVKILELNEKYDITNIDIISKIEEEELLKELLDIMYINLDGIDKIKFLKDILFNIKKDNYLSRKQEIIERLEAKNITSDEKDILEVELLQIITEINKIK